MKRILLLGIILLSLIVVKAQDVNDSLFVQKLGLKASFIQGKEILDSENVLELMESNSLAYKQMKMSRVYQYSAYPMLVVGLGFVAYPIYNKIVNDVADIRLLVGGLAVGMLAGLANTTAKSKARYAVSLYNESLNDNTQRRLRLDVGMNTNGLGLRIQF
jgi:hypothetical protein